MDVTTSSTCLTISNDKLGMLGNIDSSVGKLKHWAVSNPIASISIAAGLVGFSLGAGVTALGLAAISTFSAPLSNRAITALSREKRSDISELKDYLASFGRPQTNTVVLYSNPNELGRADYFKDQRHGKNHGHSHLRKTYHSAVLDFKNPDTLVTCTKPNYEGSCSEHTKRVKNQTINSFYFKAWKEVECPNTQVCPTNINYCLPEPKTEYETAVDNITDQAYAKGLFRRPKRERHELIEKLKVITPNEFGSCYLKEQINNIKTAWKKGTCHSKNMSIKKH